MTGRKTDEDRFHFSTERVIMKADKLGDVQEESKVVMIADVKKS